jgi:basic amino acid/polyamine antiporter, APA family
VVPFLFLAGAVVLEISTLWTKPRESISGIVLILLGLPFYFYWNKRSKARKPHFFSSPE